MLNDNEMNTLEEACKNLPHSTVQEEEFYITNKPILILMSTVLSLNRKWYIHALPARRRFEENIYKSMNQKTLDGFRSFIYDNSCKKSDWLKLSRALWKNNEKNKAKILSELVDYFINWKKENDQEADDIDVLRKWGLISHKDQFLGKIKGLGPRAYEQLLWYIDGKDAIKLDRHVTSFIDRIVIRPVAEEEKIMALTEIAKRLGISATALDARIWDSMQSGRNHHSLSY